MAETRQDELISAMSLGEGNDQTVTDPSQRPTGKACFNGEYATQAQNIQKYSAFYVSRTEDQHERVTANLTGDVDFGALEFDVDSHYTNYSFSGSDDQVLTIAAFVVMRERFATTSGGSDITSWCDTAGVGSYNQFFSDCGTSYLAKELIGGYVFLSIHSSNLTEAELLDVDATVGANSAVGNVDLSATMTQLTSLNISSLAFDVTAVGLPSPSSGLINGGKLDPAAWDTYISELQNHVNSLNPSQHCDDPTTYDSCQDGIVLAQQPDHYSAGDFIECGLPAPPDAQIQCFYDFWDQYRSIESTTSELSRKVNTAEWKLEHDDFVRWTNNQQDDMTRYQGAIDQYEQCINELLPAAAAACENAANNGNFADMCTEDCVLPEACTEDHLNDVFDTLPSAPVNRVQLQVPPEAMFAGHNEVEGGNAADTEFCGLTGIGGKFQGSGEAVYLDKTGANDNWSLTAQSGIPSSEETELIHGEAHCVPSASFYDDGGSHWSTFDVADAQADESKETIGLQGPTYATSLNGIQGHMNGLGEGGFVFYDTDDGSWKLQAKSSISSMTAWGHSFGVDAPADGIARTKGVTYLRVTDQKKSQKLIPVDHGVCYLTHLDGNFDGTGEWARVRPVDNHWEMVVKAGDGKTIRAGAQCYYYNQKNVKK